MDTTEIIMLVCDADERARRPEVLSRAGVTYLQLVYDSRRWLNTAKEMMVAMGDEFRKAADEAYKMFIDGFSEIEPMGLFAGLYDQIDGELITSVGEDIFQEHRKWYNQTAWNVIRNNWRLPARRRPRCRWRPRESRRSLDGLSPGIVVLDELHEWS